MTVAVALPPMSAAPAKKITFEIPLADHAEFMGDVDAAERAHVRERLAAFRDIASRRNAKAGATLAADRRRHLGRGWEARTLLNLFGVYCNGGYKPGDYN